jgi:hypothetical protein
MQENGNVAEVQPTPIKTNEIKQKSSSDESNFYAKVGHECNAVDVFLHVLWLDDRTRFAVCDSTRALEPRQPTALV